MTFLDIEQDLSACESHLMSTKSKGTNMESFLTQFLLIRICGQFEQEIDNIMTARACECNDPELISFIQSRFQSYKHLKLDDLRGNVLKKFGEHIRDNFDQQIKDKDPEIRYSNIITNRDTAVHQGTLQITFDELKISYFEAKKVLLAFESALN